MLKVTLGHPGSEPGLLLPKASAACTTQNKHAPCRVPALISLWTASAPTDHRSSLPRTLHSLDPPWRSPGSLYPTLFSPRRLTHVDPREIPGICSCWSWPPIHPLIAMAEIAEIKDIPHLQSGELSLAKNSQHDYPTSTRAVALRGKILQHEMVYSS